MEKNNLLPPKAPRIKKRGLNELTKTDKQAITNCIKNQTLCFY